MRAAWRVLTGRRDLRLVLSAGPAREAETVVAGGDGVIERVPPGELAAALRRVLAPPSPSRRMTSSASSLIPRFRNSAT